MRTFLGLSSVPWNAVKPHELLDETRTPDGDLMTLMRHGSEIHHPRQRQAADVEPHARLGGSARRRSAAGGARTLTEPRVLVGGLGMGFTLRATLDLLPADATVVVAELLPAVVEWNRGALGPLAGHRLRIGACASTWATSAATLRSTRALRRRAARRGQRPRRVHRIAQRRALRDRGLAAIARRSRPAACWRSGLPGRIEVRAAAAVHAFTVDVRARAGPA